MSITKLSSNQVDLSEKQDNLVAGTNITIAADGKTISATDTTYSVFTGADGSVTGTAGLVPAPSATDNTKFLKGDGTWASVSGGGGTEYTAGTGIDITNNEISVTSTVVSGAAAGATAVQPATLSSYATTASVANCPKAAVITGYTGVTGTTLTSTASGTIARIYKNGALLTVTTDYTVSSNVITFTTALISTDRVSVETEGGINKIIQLYQSDYNAIKTASALDANAFYLVMSDPV